jgi:hypothetical protein
VYFKALEISLQVFADQPPSAAWEWKAKASLLIGETGNREYLHHKKLDLTSESSYATEYLATGGTEFKPIIVEIRKEKRMRKRSRWLLVIEVLVLTWGGGF